MSTASSDRDTAAGEPAIDGLAVRDAKPSPHGIRRDPAMDAVVARLLDERAQLIATMHADGVSIRALARRAGVSAAAVSRQLGQDKDMLIGTSALLAHHLGREWRQVLVHSRHAPEVARNFRIVEPRADAGPSGTAGFTYVRPGGVARETEHPLAPLLTVF